MEPSEVVATLLNRISASPSSGPCPPKLLWTATLHIFQSSKTESEEPGQQVFVVVVVVVSPIKDDFPANMKLRPSPCAPIARNVMMYSSTPLNSTVTARSSCFKVKPSGSFGLSRPLPTAVDVNVSPPSFVPLVT